MDTVKEFELKQRKYIPVFPKATGKPTVYIEGYPSEEDDPMPATESHGVQLTLFYEQLSRYFEIDEHIHVGIDSFIYYCEGDISKRLAPDVYVVFGVAKIPLRSSFYTWEEGAVPAAVFEFLSESTAAYDRTEKVQRYLIDIGVEEYFIHQPALDTPPEFRGWRRSPSGGIVEIAPGEAGGLFSESLNLWFRSEIDGHSPVRLLRPYLPDGTPITTSREEHHLKLEAQAIAVEATERRQEAETVARAEVERRQEAETVARAEVERRQEAETVARAETERRQEAEAELERLRAQLASRQDKDA